MYSMINKSFNYVLIVLCLTIAACTNTISNLATEQLTADKLSDSLGEFCKKLPRPEYAEFELHHASNDWFEVYVIGDDVWAIYEPHQWQEVISYLIVGKDQAILFDSGNGLADIKEIVVQLTTQPIIVINSHSHIDHIGGNYQFENIASVSTDFSLKRSQGVNDASVKEEASPAALCKPLPQGVTENSHTIKPYVIKKKLNANEKLDLGGRIIEVLRIPGHTDDSIALIDREAGYLWTGDTYYAGPIWLFADETDLDAYAQSIQSLAELSSDLRYLFPAHNTPREDPKILLSVQQAFAKVMNGQETSIPEWQGVVRYQFEGFSFLLRDDSISQLNN